MVRRSRVGGKRKLLWIISAAWFSIFGLNTPRVFASIAPAPQPNAQAIFLPAATPVPPRTVIISEVAWAGTAASSYDEWLELYNPSDQPIDLTGWHLTASDGSPSIALSGTIPAHGFFLLERTDDTTVADIPADQIYTGTLSNDGEALTLFGPQGEIVDTANLAGGPWPAGSADTHATMERIGTAPDSPSAWATNNGFLTHGHDAEGNPLHGTAKYPNAANFPTPTPTATPRPTPTPTLAPVIPTPTPTFTPTATLPPPTPAATPVPPRTVIISEVAWAGTAASSYDEWLELYNPSDQPIDLTGWHLTASDGSPNIALNGTIPAHGFFLLERTDDTTVADIPADQIYTGTLSNDGEALTLFGPQGEIVDTANLAGGPWPAGSADTYATMERIGTAPDSPSAWATNNGLLTHGHDAEGNPLHGTAKYPNAANFPTPTPTVTPRPTPTPTPKPLAGRVLIGEFLPHPRYDWNRDGKTNAGDEFIEIVNLGPGPVNLDNWILDDGEGGSKPFEIPETGLMPGHVVVFFASQTGIRLNDSGDTVRLFTPDGQLVDQVSYARARAWNLSWCRPDYGWGPMVYPCWPTPGRAHNVRYQPINSPPPSPVQAAEATPLPAKRLPQTPFLPPNCLPAPISKSLGLCIR